MRSSKRGNWMTMAVGLAVTAALSTAPAVGAKKDDTLVWATDRENAIVDSSYLNTREAVIMGSLIYDRLVHLDETYRPQPSLATSWKQTDDVTLDFELRAGVKFHSGKTLDAEDVAYTLKFMADKANGSFSYSYVAWIKSVEVTGPLKVRVHMTKPFPTALVFLAGVVNIMAKGHYDSAPVKPDGKKDFGVVPVNGTGPYKLAEIKPGESVLMVRNDAYWEGSPKGKPTIGKIRYRTIKDAQTRLAEAMTGAVDWIWDVPKDQAERVKANPALVVENAKTLRVSYLTFDAQGTSPHKMFKDKRVRQAFAHAINRDAIAKSLVGAPSEAIHAACHPDQFACAADVPKYAYDPAKAKALLAEAGFPNGFEFDLHAYREREYTEAVIGDLAKVGIKAKLNFLQYSALVQQVHKGQVAVGHLTWGSSSIPDVSACAGHFFVGTPDDMTRDTALTALIKEADATVDPEKRKALWKTALSRISGEAYWLPMFTYAKYYVYAKDLDFKATSDELPQFFKAKWK